MALQKLRSPKIRRLSVVDQVSDSIKQSLLDQVWKEGDKLPSEGELAEYYGVNRLSVRMALQKLSTLGLCQTVFKRKVHSLCEEVNSNRSQKCGP